MTIYENIKNMSKEEFSELIYTIYCKGEADSKANVDDENWFLKCFADSPAENIIKILNENMG